MAFRCTAAGRCCNADQFGLFNMVGRMKDFAANPHGDPAFWTPANLILKQLAAGKSLT